MKEKTKGILLTIYFLVLFCFVSCVITFPYLEMHAKSYDYYQDAPIRKKEAGKIDFLIVGASQAVRGFDTQVIDEELNVNSYSIAKPLMTLDAREYVLDKELRRNELDTVVIEITCDALQNSRSKRGAEGILRTLGDLDSIGESVLFFVKYAKIEEYGQLYYEMLKDGIESWNIIFQRGLPSININDTKKGFRPLEDVKDVSIDKTYFDEKYNKTSIDSEFDEDNCKYLNRMLEKCKNKGVRIIICVVPVAESGLIGIKNWNIFSDYLEMISKEYDCELYDFNLMKNRGVIFPETSVFYDEGHLNNVGAYAFSKEFCKVIRSRDKECFWESYDEMFENESYREWVKLKQIDD